MKKCPVCGVEHSDIVHVCSICGSPLDEEGVAEKEKKNAQPSRPASEPTAEDVRKTISSVVTNASEEHEAPEADSYDVDSPFVINAMKDSDAPKQAANPPRGKRVSKNPGDMDTTIVAAESAQKVYEATQNAINARQAAAQNAEQKSESAEDINWSERKHTRDKSKGSQRVVLAVCAFLLLMIIAVLVVFGKMILGEDSTAAPANPTQTTEQAQQEETEPAQETEVVEPAPETEILPAEEETTEEQGVAENGEETAETAEDPDLAGAENQNQEQTETQQQEPQQTQEQEQQQTQRELPAITDVDETVYATSDVNIRDYPGVQGSNVIGVLIGGQEAKRTGTTTKGWSRVEVNGKTGYVSDKYLSTSKPSENASKSTSDATITTGGVNLRDVPNGNILATLNKGDKVKLTGKTSGAWSEVTYDGKTGYVYTSYLSTSTNSGTASADVKVTETNDTVYAVSGVNVRSAPTSSGSTVLTTLKQGDKVTRIGTTSNGWSKVKVGDITGYVYSDYLSTSKNGGSSGGNSGSGKTTGYILPKSDSHVYTQKELSKLSKSQLRLARNEIYARHGRKFNDKSLQDYFNGCSWYKGTVDAATFDANVMDYLNSTEIANLKAIAEAEG